MLQALFLVAYSVLGLLCILLSILILNLFTFQRLHTEHSAVTGAMVSILVPARNEERCIEACVRSLLNQRYAAVEVLVLDDQSSDATSALLQQMLAVLPAEQRGRLRLLHGEPLPVGWIGKNFACHQLAQQAQGDYLLFTDADTEHAPGMVDAVVESMARFNLQLLTAQPEHILDSWGERLIVPLLNFTILTLLPVALVRLRPESSLATGNGQLLCFQRSAYAAIGGHAALKDKILEDVLLARAMKAAGYRIAFMDALLVTSCRMYHSFAEVWTGFSKNLFAFYNYSLAFAFCALILNLFLFVVPPLFVLAAIFVVFPPPFTLIALGAYLLPVLMRILLTLRFIRRQRMLLFLLCFLHPFSILLESLILLNSIRWYYRKTGTSWKGRTYQRTPSHN